jgi:hypothetical protein
MEAALMVVAVAEETEMSSFLIAIEAVGDPAAKTLALQMIVGLVIDVLAAVR